MRAVRILSLSAACLLAAVWVETASALIVPQKSIAGIALNMTRPEVRAAKGDPPGVERGRNDFGRYTIYKYGGLRVTFQGNAGATAVFTNRRRQHTAKGIHVGSTEAELRAAYPGLHCRTEFGEVRHCWTGRFQAGRRVTDYRIGMVSGVVRNVVVAFVID